MKRFMLCLTALCLLFAAAPAAANVDLFISDQIVPYRGYEYHDIIDIQDSIGTVPIPNAISPYRILRVETLMTKQEIIYLMEKGNSGKRRAYYLDRSKMIETDPYPYLIYWDINRALVDVPEATAMGWLTRKTGQ